MKKAILLLITIAIFTGGCKKYLDVNKDPNNPLDVQEDLILSPLETYVSDFVYAGFSPGQGPIILQYFGQVIAPNQLNPGLWNYRMFNTDMDGDWYNFYVVCLNNMKILHDKAMSNDKPNYAAIADVLSAYTLGTATDFWGDIPYSKGFAGSSNFTPSYDKQEDLYKTVQDLLSEAIVLIGKNDAKRPGSADYIYNGTMSQWLKLAYTLKARYFMHLTKAPGHTAAVQADSALAALSQGMLADSNDFKFPYAGDAGGENPWYYAFGQVSTAVLCSTFIDSLQVRNDPRLSKMANPPASGGPYKGRTIGAPLGVLTEYSYPTDYYAGASAYNYIVNYSEAQFLAAEATFIKSGAAAAEPIYQAAVTNHMKKLGVAQGDITTYLASRGSLTAGNALQRIMEEKSIANFLNEENFTDWRRTGFPLLTKVQGGLSDIPRRLLYPQSEILTNPQPQQSAALTDRVWWDMP
jgi:hypothetical protein